MLFRSTSIRDIQLYKQLRRPGKEQTNKQSSARTEERKYRIGVSNRIQSMGLRSVIDNRTRDEILSLEIRTTLNWIVIAGVRFCQSDLFDWFGNRTDNKEDARFCSITERNLTPIAGWVEIF